MNDIAEKLKKKVSKVKDQVEKKMGMGISKPLEKHEGGKCFYCF